MQYFLNSFQLLEIIPKGIVILDYISKLCMQVAVNHSTALAIDIIMQITIHKMFYNV